MRCYPSEDEESGWGSGSISSGDYKNGTISNEMFRIIKGWEGFAPNMYYDTSNVATIGYGITYAGEQAIFNKLIANAPIDEETGAKAFWETICKNYSSYISKNCGEYLNSQCQFDALVSLSYNTNPYSVASSSIMTAIKNKKSESEIRALWESYKITSGGQVLQGLVNRRKGECDWFFGKTTSLKPTTIGIVKDAYTITGSIKGDGWLPN